MYCIRSHPYSIAARKGRGPGLFALALRMQALLDPHNPKHFHRFVMRDHMQVLEQTSDAAGRGGLELVRTAVHALVGACFPSGNLPSSLDSESDRWDAR